MRGAQSLAGLTASPPHEEEVAMTIIEPRIGEAPPADIRARLLDEYLELKERLSPLEKRLEEVRDRLKDLVTEHGHFVDELRGVLVRVEPRFRKEYDPEKLQASYPRLRACVRPSVDIAQLDACLRAGMVTETELEREGVMTRALQSRALVVKPLLQRHSERAREPL